MGTSKEVATLQGSGFLTAFSVTKSASHWVDRQPRKMRSYVGFGKHVRIKTYVYRTCKVKRFADLV